MRKKVRLKRRGNKRVFFACALREGANVTSAVKGPGFPNPKSTGDIDYLTLHTTHQVRANKLHRGLDVSPPTYLYTAMR